MSVLWVESFLMRRFEWLELCTKNKIELKIFILNHNIKNKYYAQFCKGHITKINKYFHKPRTMLNRVIPVVKKIPGRKSMWSWRSLGSGRSRALLDITSVPELRRIVKIQTVWTPDVFFSLRQTFKSFKNERKKKKQSNYFQFLFLFVYFFREKFKFDFLRKFCHLVCKLLKM